MTNCINCGAPLHGYKCEYCGTEYRDSPEQEAQQLREESVRPSKIFERCRCFPTISWLNYPSAATLIGAINSDLQNKNNDII